MRYEVKSLGAWAFVKVSFFLNLIIGFVFGLLYAGFMALMLAISSAMPFDDVGQMPFDTDIIGPMFFILLPFIFAVGGAIFQTLFGLIIIGAYNLIAKFVGGIEMTLDPVEQTQPVHTEPMQPPPPPPLPAPDLPPSNPNSETP
ncbi:MAG: DUF3566 domain-containing protein [candidate division Zixibacteria bacterium]|nr:DUF3566 domain-containing protein [candidate division Zixibacteria bacterium]